MTTRRTGRFHNAFAYGRWVRKGEFITMFGTDAWRALPAAEIRKDGRREAVSYMAVVEAGFR
jgi:hypothetical protein